LTFEQFVLESMEECGSEGLKDLLYSESEGFLRGVDLVVVSDNYWLGRTRPCLTYGLRGLCYFFLEVECGTKDLHSGVFGGAVREALPDLIYLLNSLVDAEGNVLVQGLLDDVTPLTGPEEDLYASIDFDINDFQDDIGVYDLRTQDKVTRPLSPSNLT
jgi:nonspecific dipeptidase